MSRTEAINIALDHIHNQITTLTAQLDRLFIARDVLLGVPAETPVPEKKMLWKDVVNKPRRWDDTRLVKKTKPKNLPEMGHNSGELKGYIEPKSAAGRMKEQVINFLRKQPDNSGMASHDIMTALDLAEAGKRGKQEVYAALYDLKKSGVIRQDEATRLYFMK